MLIMQLAKKLLLANVSKQSFIGMKMKYLIKLCLNIGNLYYMRDRCWFGAVYTTADGHTVDWHSVCFYCYVHGIKVQVMIPAHVLLPRICIG